MFGSGVLKGLGVTLRQFVATYIDDFKQIPSRYAGGRKLLDQTEVPPEGLFTVQYPEERRKVAERFRYIPMLIYEAETGEDRCTACGICVGVCPRRIIALIPRRQMVYLGCVSRDRGKNVKEVCAVGCTACGLCASPKVTPSGSVIIRENLPEFPPGWEDFKAAAEKCPSRCFVIRRPLPSGRSPGADAAAPGGTIPGDRHAHDS